MATEQPVPERPTPDWHVEPHPCPFCPKPHPTPTAETLRWDGDDS